MHVYISVALKCVILATMMREKKKETNFYIFYRGRWEIYFNFLSIFNSTDGLFDLQNS